VFFVGLGFELYDGEDFTFFDWSWLKEKAYVYWL
jgi:hypothetical protein